MARITLLNAQLAFGHVALLDHTDLAIEAAERVGLIGRNGAGKSSLLKILAGLEKADDSVLQLQQGLRIPYVAREPVLDARATVFTAVTAVRQLPSLYVASGARRTTAPASRHSGFAIFCTRSRRLTGRIHVLRARGHAGWRLAGPGRCAGDGVLTSAQGWRCAHPRSAPIWPGRPEWLAGGCCRTHAFI